MAKKSKNFHVIPRDGSWAVKVEGGSKASSVHHTQREAIDRAREIVRNQYSGELVIHGRDGRIRARESYGSDSFPSKSPRKVLFPKSGMVTSKEAIEKAVHKVVQKSHEDPQVKASPKRPRSSYQPPSAIRRNRRSRKISTLSES